MTNKEYIQSCSEEELAEELEAFDSGIDFCEICPEAYSGSRYCYSECQTTLATIKKWLNWERISEDDE